MADGHCRYAFENHRHNSLVWYGYVPDCLGSCYRLNVLVGATVDSAREMKCDISADAGQLLTVRTPLDVCSLRGDGLFRKSEASELTGFVIRFRLVRPEISFK
jgi:hypothetical protein